jgi:Family of unknown function (DUF6308)
MNLEFLEVGGIRIAKPLEKLRKKFGFDGINVPFDLYDGYRTPAEQISNVNVLELEDLLITVAMNSRIGATAMMSFWKGIVECESWYVESNSLLARLPIDLHLAEASNEHLAIILRLFATCCGISGVKIAVAAKILCRKRPRSIPMLDSNVLPLVCHLSLEDDAKGPLIGPPWANWRDIDRALRFLRKGCFEGQSQLDALCQSFRELPGSPALSPLRALESLLWWELWQDEARDPRIERFREFWGWNKSG